MTVTLPGNNFQQFVFLKNVQISGLKYAGFWTLTEKSPAVLQYAYFVYKGLMLTIIVTFAITILAEICRSTDDLSIATDDGCILAGISVIIFKTMMFQFCRRKIIQLIEETIKCGEELCDFSNADITSIINAYALHLKVTFYGFSTLGALLVIALLFFAPTDPGELPIRANYPFDVTTSPWHQVGFVIEMLAVCAGMNAIVCIDSLTTLTCNLVIMQFDILNVNFENCRSSEKGGFNPDISSNPNDPKDGDEIRGRVNFIKRYKTCLQFHQRLGRIVLNYNKAFGWSMFVQMLASTSMICLTGFQAVVIGGQSPNVLKFGIYLLAAVSQLFYICWIGNELIFTSSTVGRSQWLSGWHYEPTASVAQLLNLSTFFSRRSFTLKAGGFYTLSTETFIAIMRVSYSVFTLLNNIHSAGDE